MIGGIGHRLIEYDGWECEGITGTSAAEASHQPDQGQRNYSQCGIQAPYLCGMRSNFFLEKISTVVEYWTNRMSNPEIRQVPVLAHAQLRQGRSRQ